MMVDKNARNKLAEQIRYFLSCLTDNIEFDNAIFNIKTADKAVKIIRDQMWYTYDDIWRHKLIGKRTLSESDELIIKRFILFLKTDFEYEANDIKRNDLWPFLNRQQYEMALNKPMYLNKAT